MKNQIEYYKYIIKFSFGGDMKITYTKFPRRLAQIGLVGETFNIYSADTPTLEILCVFRNSAVSYLDIHSVYQIK